VQAPHFGTNDHANLLLDPTIALHREAGSLTSHFYSPNLTVLSEPADEPNQLSVPVGH
jgi:hypothetical protein